jgi:hypothetical protein
MVTCVPTAILGGKRRWRSRHSPAVSIREASVTSRKAGDHIAGHPVMFGFPRSATEPDPRHVPLRAGCCSGRPTGRRPNASRTPLPSPRFRHRPRIFGTSSVARLRTSLRISPGEVKSPPFPRRSPPTLLTPTSRSGLEPIPGRRLRGPYPHLPCGSTAPSQSVCSRHT